MPSPDAVLAQSFYQPPHPTMRWRPYPSQTWSSLSMQKHCHQPCVISISPSLMVCDISSLVPMAAASQHNCISYPIHLAKPEGCITILGLNVSRDMCLNFHRSYLECNNVHLMVDISVTSMMEKLQNAYPERRDELMGMLGISPESRMHQLSLSVGQQWCLQLMIQLVWPFWIMLLDDVTKSLDVCSCQDLLRWLRKESIDGTQKLCVPLTSLMGWTSGHCTYSTSQMLGVADGRERCASWIYTKSLRPRIIQQRCLPLQIIGCIKSWKRIEGKTDFWCASPLSTLERGQCGCHNQGDVFWWLSHHPAWHDVWPGTCVQWQRLKQGNTRIWELSNQWAFVRIHHSFISNNVVWFLQLTSLL